MKQALSRIVLSVFWIVALGCPVTVQALDPSLLIPETELNSNVVQFYKIPFAARGSLWDPNIPVFAVKESVSVGPYGLGQGQVGAIKEYCDPFDIVCADFGARLLYGLDAGAGLKLDAGADFGSVDVEYPMQVVIEYPHRPTLRELSEFTIKTRYYPQGTAKLLSYFEPAKPPFTASLKAPIKLLTGLTVQAALGVRLPDLCPLGPLFCKFGENKEVLLFDLDQYFRTNFSGEQDLTPLLPSFVRGLVSGSIHVPRLVGNGGFGAPNNPQALYSIYSDDFLTMGVNISGIIAKSVGLPVPLKDRVTLIPGVEPFYNILELGVGASVGAVQELTFEPRPMITFDVRDEFNSPVNVRDESGAILPDKTIEAGKSVRICCVPRAPRVLTVRPTITPDHIFKNETTIQAGPSARVHPFEIGVDFARIDLGFTAIEPDVRFNPFNGPFNARFRDLLLDLAAYSNQFKLPHDVQSQHGDMVEITADTRAPVLVTVCPFLTDPQERFDDSCSKAIFPRSSPRRVLLLAGRVEDEPDTYVLVNGQRMTRERKVETTQGAVIPFYIPGDLQQQEGTLRVQVANRGRVDPDIGLPGPDQFSNTVDLTVLPVVLPPEAFGPVQSLQYPGIHHLDISASAIGGLPSLEGLPEPQTELVTAGNGLMLLETHLQTVGSRVAPDSILLWNSIPLATEVVLTDSTETADGTLYFYNVTAAVPSSLQLKGGPQQLSFLNAGVNAPETTLSTPITIRYPVPVIGDVLTIAPQNAPAGGVSISVSGSGFTPDSVVYWDGAVRTTSYGSASLLFANLSSADQTVGDHRVYVINPQPGGGQSNVFIHTTPGPIALPFASCEDVTVTIINEDTIMAKGTCTLRPNSDGVDPRTEDVRLSAWTFSTTIPAGSFKLVDSQYHFKGVIDDVTLQVEIKMRKANRFDFHFEGKGAELSGEGDVILGLYIGNDGGSTPAAAKFVGTSN